MHDVNQVVGDRYNLKASHDEVSQVSGAEGSVPLVSAFARSPGYHARGAACDHRVPVDRLNISGEYPPGKELFELSNGVNEFDLEYVDGFYYLFHHDFNVLHTSVRRATSLQALANAADHSVLPGLYHSDLR